MFTGKKLIALLVALSFALQSCARGVSPTQGLKGANELTEEGELEETVNQQLCLMEGDVDTDGDGICDLDDVNGDGYSCADDIYCIKGDDLDTYSEAKKSKWLLWTGIVGVAAIAGTWFATSKSGWGKRSWPLDLIDNNEQKDLDQTMLYFKKENAAGLTDVVADSKEEFTQRNGQPYTWRTDYISIGEDYAFGHDYRTINGNMIRKGSEIAMCTSGRLGVAAPNAVSVNWQTANSDGTSGPGVTKNVQKVRTTVYIDKATFNSKTKALSRQKLTKSQFDTLCKNNPGVFVGFTTKPKVNGNESKFYTYAYPLELYRTFADAGTDYALDVDYMFEGQSGSFPATAAAMIGTKFRRFNPNYTTFQTVDHKISSIGSVEANAYDGCANDTCRANALFAIFNQAGASQAAMTNKTEVDPAAKATLEQQITDQVEAATANAQKNPESDHNADLVQAAAGGSGTGNTIINIWMPSKQ